MRCSSCGHENPEAAAFCGTCGKKLEGTPKQTKASPGNRKLALPLGVALMLIIGAASFLSLRHGRSQNSPTNATVGAATGNSPKYKVTDLGDMIPIAINDDSQVLWQQGYKAAGLWQGGKITNLSVGDVSMFLNNKGAVLVGGQHDPELWQDGHTVELAQQPNFPNKIDLDVLGFNDNGQILLYGQYGPGFFDEGGVVWQAGQITHLVNFMSRHGAINSHGVVVGIAHFNDHHVDDKAAMWQNGELTELGNLDSATGINDSNQVIGRSSTKNLCQK